MRESARYLYNYLNYNPQIGIVSAATSYLIAVKTLILTDESLKLIASISTCAGCFVACLSALSMLIRTSNYFLKIYHSLKNRKT